MRNFCLFLLLTISVISTVSAQAVKIMPLGDSITFGTRSSDGSGYRKALYEKLTAAGYKIQMVGSQSGGAFPQPANEGHPGWDMDQLAPQVPGWLKTYQPDIVLLMMGTNDVFHKLPNRQAALSSLIDSILTTLPKAKVVVAAITPTFEPKDQDYNQFVPVVVKQKQAEGKAVTFVDQFHCGMTLEDTPDAIHPNDAGYEKMAEVWYPAVVAAISGNSSLPSAPLHLTATAGPGQVLLHWDTAYDAGSYMVERHLVGNLWRIVAKGITGFRYADTSVKNGAAYSYRIAAINARDSGPNSNTVTATPMANLPIAINCGGNAVGSYADDTDVVGGEKGTWGFYDTMKVDGVSNPAPQDVYKTYRLGDCVYTIPGLIPGKKYTVRLHFCEFEHDKPGQRFFHV